MLLVALYLLVDQLCSLCGVRCRMCGEDKRGLQVWILAAQFELRQGNLDGARQILDDATRLAPNNKIFEKYIEIELKLGQISHCRALYEKYVLWDPANCYSWSKFAELERSLREMECARIIFELAISQSEFDLRELLGWHISTLKYPEGEFERARQLYEMLLSQTKHVRAWISYAKFEAFVAEAQPKKDEVSLRELKVRRLQCCCGVFQRAYDFFIESAPELKDEIANLLEEWISVESSFGSLGDAAMGKKSPKQIKRKRAILSEDGSPAGFEEYIDYIFFLMKQQ